MHILTAFLAPFSLIAASTALDDMGSAGHLTPPEAMEETAGVSVADTPILQELNDAYLPVIQNQVRIEQRVIIRVNPHRSPVQPNFLNEFPHEAEEPAPHYIERKMGDCVPIAGIVGVQAGQGNRLLLYMRDRRVVGASLEKSCRSRDFYSGFYVERNEDGMLCVKRDKLQSRAGASCGLNRLRRLVLVRD